MSVSEAAFNFIVTQKKKTFQNILKLQSKMLLLEI